MVKWKKLGLIFEPGHYDWMASHAQNPFQECLGGALYRVHFASRDNLNRSRGGYFDFNIENPSIILKISDKPTIDLGSLGAFDDSGAMPSSIVQFKGNKYMYYTGWSQAVTVPFSFHIGIVISEDEGETYQRYSTAPVLGRVQYDPYIVGAPFVLYEDNIFKMWYSSCTEWTKDAPDSKAKHHYTVKYAESKDGISWQTSPHLCIEYLKDEYAIARPIVFKEDGAYLMWFTFRGGMNKYRVGTARSEDGKKWDRSPDALGIDVSKNGWDSEMICYASPLKHEGKLYALYNGNNYGEMGIGIAVWEDE